MLVFTDKEQDTPGVVAVTAMTLVNAAVMLAKLRLWVSPVMVGQASRVAFDDDDDDPILPRLRERSSVLAPCSLVIRAAGTMSRSRPRPATRFPEAGKALRLWRLLRRQTTSSSVSGWMK